MKLITKETFKKIFAVYEDRYGRQFVRVSFRNNTIYLNLGHLYASIGIFIETISKIGFVNCTIPNYNDKFRLKILPEYTESIKNLFDLAISDDKANVEVAYQIFQNIREYAILETPEPIVEVPKPIETPPEKVDFSKYKLGNVEYSEEERNNLISKKHYKKIKKTHKTQINIFATN